MRPDHTYDPSIYCRACDLAWPKGCKTGCHRRTDGVYSDDPDSAKNKRSKTDANTTTDPWSGN